MSTEEQNTRKMLNGEPYRHEGLTEYGGLPPMSPKPNVSGKRRVIDKKYREMINNFTNKRSAQAIEHVNKK